ncbi:dipeptidyl peptidase 3-like [Contarinia nasturtii]|uniref:dipeptidyl peptidase 3-like n=1 Tax=Contarinia nasturtii TaxID=265458 RepID=UPI0012D3F611|nr:dipeptidyl peptidase 3-like [Contarinia nasturtii]
MQHGNPVDKSDFVLSNEQRIEELNIAAAFAKLPKGQKLYAHYYSQASRYMGMVALFQCSPEAPLIHSLFHRIFRVQAVEDLRAAAFKAGVSNDDFEAFLVYVVGFFANNGNYKGMGDTKFVPNLDVSQFKLIIKTSQAFKKDHMVSDLWDRCKKPIFYLTERTKSIGLANEGITTYFSENCTKLDSDRITDFLQAKNIIPYNTRAFKIEDKGKVTYHIKLGAFKKAENMAEVYKGNTFIVSRGDYSPLLELVNKNLAKAKDYAQNVQLRVVGHYIDHFRHGKIGSHKEATTFWLEDSEKPVETYLGYIAPYRDPAGIRAEYNGLVAMSNSDKSEKLSKLANNAKHFLQTLPWPAQFEKDTFINPDFAVVDVLTFDGSVVPSGLSIPPYEDIRQNYGFKNLSLDNVLTANIYRPEDEIQFLSDEDQDLMKAYQLIAQEVHVCLHEVLGHGSGKLLIADEDGKLNFDVFLTQNPLNHELIKTWYEKGETFVMKFGSISSPYEECRSEAVALHLSLYRNVLSIFDITEDDEVDNVTYVIWLRMVWMGLTALEFYDPTNQKWLQAHSQARYVLLQVLMEAGNDFVRIKETEDGRNLRITVDRTKIKSTGRRAIHDFLLKLQIYKSTADVVHGTAMFNDYAKVTNDSEPYTWENWREIVMAHKKPKTILLQSNTELKGNEMGGEMGGEVILKSYEPTLTGFIESCVDRFRSDDKILQIIEELWIDYRDYWPTLTRLN